MTPLRFACVSGCTNCCDVQGYVYMTEGDLENAAAFLGLTPQQFGRKYVYRTRHLRRLRKPRNSQCHFLREGGCAIHPAKPTQCRAFPFWPELVGSRVAWKRVARYCPGIGQGPLVTIESAIRVATGMREAYPTLYGG